MILRKLNQIAGGLAGAVMFPLTTSVAELFRAVLLLRIALIPRWLTWGFGGRNRLFAFMVLLLMVLLTPVIWATVMFVVIPVFSVILSAKVLVQSFYSGIKQGYKHGLFFYVFKQPFVDLSKRIYVYLRNPSSVEPLQEPDSTPDKGPNPDDSPDFANLTQPSNDTSLFVPLTETELNAAKTIPELKKSLDQYYNSYNNLIKLLDAIEMRVYPKDSLKVVIRKGQLKTLTDEDLSDELISLTSMVNPSLLTKECEVSPGIWKVEQGSSKMTDQANCMPWIKEKRGHPLTRDPLWLREGDKRREYRYRLTPFRSMDDALETKQAAADIRRVLDQRPEKEVSSIGSGLGFFPPTASGMTTTDKVIQTIPHILP